MASPSFLLVGFLIFGSEIIVLGNNSDGMEKEELLSLLEVLGALLEDPNWGQMHPQPCTDTPWPGLQCEIGENPPLFHVTKIHITPDIACKTSAALSPSLLKLPYLKTLSIFNCFQKSPVYLAPSVFGRKLSSLEHLALESNPSLNGGIPTSLTEIGSLRVLRLSQNNLQGEIPKEINGLVNLEQLDLSYNNLSGAIPPAIGELKWLSILDLSWNGLEGNVPCSLGQAQMLQKIDLSYNRLGGNLPKEFGQLKRLVLLDLGHNFLGGPIPEAISDLEDLEVLVMEGNPIKTWIPSVVGNLRSLRILSFSDCGLTGPIPTSFAFLKNLTSLALDNNSLNGTIPPFLGALQNLYLLNVSQNELNGELVLPDEFIDRLGNRLAIRGNSGLCINDSFINKNIPTYLQLPFCLDAKGPSKNSSCVEENANDFKRVNLSSNIRRPKRKLIVPFFAVCFFCFFL